MKRTLLSLAILTSILGCQKSGDQPAKNEALPKKAKEVIYCAQDVKECPDGSFVPRDSDNNCQFKPCPK